MKEKKKSFFYKYVGHFDIILDQNSFLRLSFRSYLVVVSLALMWLTAGCGGTRTFYADPQWEKVAPYPLQDRQYTVFFIGDAGKPNIEGADLVLNALRDQIRRAGKSSAVVFLGDNIYSDGLPDPSDPSYPEAKARIDKQLKILEGYEGGIVFIAGNHDWNEGKEDGWARVMRQENYIEKKLARTEQNVFLPDNGTAGPAEVSLDAHLTLLALDTQWRLHPHAKAEPYAESELSFRLHQALLRNRYKQILVIGHHPLFSVGTHAGYIPWYQHIFPLTAIKKNLYIPLPILGSIYVAARKWGASPQDMANKRYDALRRELFTAFQPVDRLIYVSGHDHSLQYFDHGRHHYIVSGSGSKSDPIPKKGATFASNQKGFFRLDFFAGGRIQVEAYTPENGLIYRTRLR